MWRRVAMRKRLYDSLLTRFDSAVYYDSTGRAVRNTRAGAAEPGRSFFRTRPWANEKKLFDSGRLCEITIHLR
ncbi:hypothetical protein EVAR_17564_1 [Eumeta japonica]|uniref:Uncharacterized protein n=1 Tax=Eumeta variegata TaxID=151549 RepID=A0A4C1UCT4_EUMVA|nr:hypothetical protein EVAR_17564_1 [Eumeta japonica]